MREIPNPKHQIPRNIQAPNGNQQTKDQEPTPLAVRFLFGALDIGIWGLFGIWCLSFGACGISDQPLGRVEMWRGGLGWAYPWSGTFVSRCLTSPTMLRFHIPLIEPDVRISRIRLSDKVVTRSHTEGPATARLFLRLGVQCRLRLLNLGGLIGSRQFPGPSPLPALTLN